MVATPLVIRNPGPDAFRPPERGPGLQTTRLLDLTAMVGDRSDVRPKRYFTYEEYHPFGTTSWWATNGSTDVSAKRYTGKERDDETGLGYHGARYYAAWLGRWERPDPAGMVDGPNRLAYCRGSPVGGSDPTGMGAQQTGTVVHDGEEMLAFGGDEHPAEEVEVTYTKFSTRVTEFLKGFGKGLLIGIGTGLVAAAVVAALPAELAIGAAVVGVVALGAAVGWAAAEVASHPMETAEHARKYATGNVAPEEYREAGEFAGEVTGTLAVGALTTTGSRVAASGRRLLPNRSMRLLSDSKAGGVSEVSLAPEAGAVSEVPAARKPGFHPESPALIGSVYNPDVVAARVRPPYAANPAHAPTPSGRAINPLKSPEPSDAAQMGTWYGKGEGGWYRFFSDHDLTSVHFSGLVDEQDVPAHIVRNWGR